MNNKITFIFTIIFLCSVTLAQHKHHEESDKDTMKIKEDMDMMTHAYSLSLVMNRNGSGTSWLPDESPMYGYMHHAGAWMMMFHGSIFIRYTAADISKVTTRGASLWDAPNWFMGMAQRKIGPDGLLKFSLMMSLDRATEGGRGYPILFQTGETWEGKRLVDRQHPHDLFSELSIGYTQRITKDIDITGYFGYPGEPALGPVAFMHRPSSFNNADAPLSHHWQDATHIVFGAGTIGFRYTMFKLETSIFTGSEPDENRFDFDKPKFNSYSYRLMVNPGKNFALQFSQGFLKSPEVLEPGFDITRTTASVIYSHNFAPGRNVNAAFIWGQNSKKYASTTNSFLLEGNLQLNKMNIYGRYELIGKDAEELGLTGVEPETRFDINALTLGANYRIARFGKTDFTVGFQGSAYFTPSGLHAIYSDNPLSAQVYLKISPALMNMEHKSESHQH